MSGINIKNFLNGFVNRQMQSGVANFNVQKQAPKPAVQAQAAQPAPQIKSPVPEIQTPQNMQMNTLKSIDRAIYAKDLMGVPKNLNEFVYMLQRGMTQQQFNRMFSAQLLSQKNSLSQLQAQILAQLQGVNLKSMQELVNKQMATQLQSSLKNLDILSNGMINLNSIAQMIQTNGKEALTKLIMSMTEASKMGITDLTQMKDMAKLINASISVAAEREPTKTLKLLLMLYLPWLPLKEGVDFDLEVTQGSDGHSESDSILTVTITTINYGTVVATLILETSNSVQIMIECSPDFPKEELNTRLEIDKKHYSMNTLTTYDVKKDLGPKQQRAQANVNMSQTTEINPYLLLSAHSIIRHVIDIDNNTSLGITTHQDF